MFLEHHRGSSERRNMSLARTASECSAMGDSSSKTLQLLGESINELIPLSYVRYPS